MMKRYDIERICLGFLIGGLFIGLLYIIFPEQRPCSLKPSQEHTQIMEKLDSIESRLEGDNCFIYYGTEVGYVNVPCPDDLYGEHDRP